MQQALSQTWIRCIALAMALPFAPIAWGSSEAATSTGGLTARAAVDIAIKIPKVMQMRLLGHPAALDITADDVARGSVTVSGPAIDLLVNDRLGYNLRAELLSAVFTAVRIAGLPAPLQVVGQAGSARMPSMVGRPKPQPLQVAYELELAADAAPGRYAWPVALSLQEP
jgi:hypothetical protein